MNELALFAGAGGGILGGKLLGWRTVCAVEWDAYAASVLVARQNECHLEPFPIWDDVQTFDGRPWRGIVDVISGGFPCQDISVAGKGAGIDGDRSGMWRHMARIIGEVRPRFVLVENSPALVSRGLARVLGDLASMGYDAKWGIVGADDVGAPHIRKRIWIVADAMSSRERGQSRQSKMEADAMAYSNLQQGGLSEQPRKKSAETIWNRKAMGGTNGERLEERDAAEISDAARLNRRTNSSWWESDPADEPQSKLGRVAHGVAENVDTDRGLDYIHNHERKQLFKTGAKSNERCEGLSGLRWGTNKTPSTPQRQGQGKQSEVESNESLSGMSQRDSCKRWGLGPWKVAIENGEVQDLREVIYAETLSRNQKEFLVWLGAMSGYEWVTECVQTLGTSPRVANQVKNRSDRLKAIGNGQVPSVVKLAWETLSKLD